MSDKDEAESRRSGTQHGWAVEARAALEDHPLQVGEQVFTTKWKRVHFDRAKIGVPAGNPDFDEYLKFGLVSYPAAQALRWWFTAALVADHKLSLLTRLVRYRVDFQSSAHRIAEFDSIDFFEDNRAAANCTGTAGVAEGLSPAQPGGGHHPRTARGVRRMNSAGIDGVASTSTASSETRNGGGNAG